MVKKIIFISILTLLTACKSYDFAGKKYVSSTDEQRVSLNFISDTVVEVKQEYFCLELSENFRATNFKAKYDIEKLKLKTYDRNYKSKKLKVDALIIRNQECTDCEKYTQIPNYESLGCTNTDMLDERLKEKAKFGIIYNLSHDTLLIKGNEISFGNLTLTEQ